MYVTDDDAFLIDNIWIGLPQMRALIALIVVDRKSDPLYG